MNNKITFPELVDLVAKKANTSKRVSELFLKEFFAAVADTLASGQSVRVKGIGTFKLTQVSPRRSVNVNTGQEIEIPSHNKLTFTASNDMADAVNQPFAQFETVLLSDDVTAEELAAIDHEPVSMARPETVIAEAGQKTAVEAEAPAAEEKPADQDGQLAAAVPPPFRHMTAQEVEPEENPIVQEPEAAEESQQFSDFVETRGDDDSEDCVDCGQEPEESSGKGRVKWLLAGFAAGVAFMLLLPLLGYGLRWWQPVASRQPQSQPRAERVAPKPHMAPKPEVKPLPKAADSVSAHPKPAAVVVTDTVTTRLSLMGMSRKHYGASIFWVYIYEENSAKIKNPNKVRDGQVLVIPPAEKYGIDAKDKKSVERAKKRAAEIFAKTAK